MQLNITEYVTFTRRNMKLILCENCKQPLIEDIGDIRKCKECKKGRVCSLRSSQCNKCRLNRHCTEPEVDKQKCLNCMKPFKYNLDNFPKCKICYNKDMCPLIGSFCKDCLELIHKSTYGLEQILSSFNKNQKNLFDKKIREIIEKGGESDFPFNIDDFFPLK
jgi:hypothetical protein